MSKKAFLAGLAILNCGIIGASQVTWREMLEEERPSPGIWEGEVVEESLPAWEAGMLIGTIGIRRGQSREEIEEEFQNATATKVLFTNSAQWILVLDDIYRYVKENAHDNPKLMTTALLVKEAGSALSMSIHLPGDPTSLETLKNYKEKLQEKADILADTRFYLKAKDKNNAKEVLMMVINFLLPHIGMVAG